MPKKIHLRKKNVKRSCVHCAKTERRQKFCVIPIILVIDGFAILARQETKSRYTRGKLPDQQESEALSMSGA